MRPVVRGDLPKDAKGNDVEFEDYKNARNPLIERIGDFCSYCEVALHSAVQVEHIQPKSLHKDIEKSWENFLLACDYCNPTKGDKDVVLDDYYWPHIDNTARALDYVFNQVPSPAGGLTGIQRAIVQATIELTGLDRMPGHRRLSPRDRRWSKRQEVWGVALLSRKLLKEVDSPQMRNLVILNALSRGFWSVWMQVFHDDQDMRRRLLKAFPGTALECFDAKTNAVPRAGGRI